MRFGLILANAVAPDPDTAVALGQAAEKAGFESVWTVDHVLIPGGYQSSYPYSRDGRLPRGPDALTPDPLIWLAFLAAATTSLRLATGVLVLPQRDPAVVAKQVATLDQLSRGRVELGVAAGWLEEEFDALGVPFAARGRRLDAYIDILRALWTGEEVTRDDGYVRYDRVISRPTPHQARIPIVIGGESEAAARRAGRLGDGFMPGKGDLAALRDVMRRAADEAGRDGDAIEITAGSPKLHGDRAHEEVERLAGLGVSRVVVAPPALGQDALPDALADYGERVVSQYLATTTTGTGR